MYSSTTGLDVIADNRSGCIRRPQVWMYSPTTGLDVFVDNRSGCNRRQQVWMYSPTTGLDVFADDRSGCNRRQQVWMYSSTTGLDVIADNRSGCIRRPQVWMYSPTAGHAATAAPGAGRRARQGPNPRAREIEVTRARYPLPGPRHTSPPLTLVCAGARGSPRLTGAARNARAHAGQPWSSRCA